MPENGIQNFATWHQPDERTEEGLTAEARWNGEERRCGLVTAWKAFAYLSSLNRDHLRKSDRWTERFLTGALCVLGAILVTPQKYVVAMIIACDLFLAIALLMFITNRFGILILLRPKEAAIVWDLILGFCILTLFLIAQVTAIYFLIRNLTGLH